MRKTMIIVAALAAVLAGCSGDGSAATTTTRGPEALLVTSGVLGEYLSSSLGRTVYVYLEDGDAPTCTASCAATWPPVPGDVTAGDGVSADLLRSATRDDGSSQATYDGRPLYFYVGDDDAGEFNGQGIDDAWYVIGPDGAPILPPPLD